MVRLEGRPLRAQIRIVRQVDPTLLSLALPALSLSSLIAAGALYVFTRRYTARAWRELAEAEQDFALRLRAARIRPAQREESDPDVAWQGFRKFRVTRKVLEDHKSETASFYLAPLDGRRLPPYPPGAYLNLRVEIPELGLETRSYSISGGFTPDYYRLSIKRVPGWTDAKGKAIPPGKVSNFVHDHVHEGSVVDVSAPNHCPHFVLDMESDAPVVLLGGGVGITPMICMWEEVVTRQPTRPVWLFYGVRGSAELMDAADEISALHSMLKQVGDDQRLWLCFSRVKPELDAEGRVVGMSGGETEGDRVLCERSRQLLVTGQQPRVVHHYGRVSVKSWVWDVLPPNFRDTAHFYTCGPGPFMKAIRVDLLAKGVPDRRIHFEEFGADSHDALTDVVETACEVVFSRGGRSAAAPWEGWRRDLQRLAKANEVSIRGHCGVGACGECETPILSGRVQHTRDPLPYEPSPGCCLPCVAVPHPDCERLELQA